MFTDIVGYTALMGSDESRAFELLRKNRELHRKWVRKYQGELVKEMGDGMLIRFRLASDAVRCGIAIQQEAKNLKIPLRIGIHEGEMVFEGADVLGDGVNIASRLQEICDPGAIFISGSIYRDVKNKPDIQADFREERTLKNVDEPVKIYQVRIQEYKGLHSKQTAPPSYEAGKRKGWYLIAALFLLFIISLVIWYPFGNQKNNLKNKTIAVLPFHDDSPGRDNEYFCNGMMEEILNHLQKIGDLQVKSRTSVEQYRNPMRDIKAIGKELQVAYLVEGSVRKFGDELRITAQLIATHSGNHLWSEIYDGKYTNEIFDFQSEVAKRIAASLNAVITPVEKEKIEQLPTNNIEAYDNFQKAGYEEQLFWKTRDREHLKRAHELLDKALEVDPDYIWALAKRGNVFIAEGRYDSAFVYAERVLKMDPDFGWGYMVKGEYYRFTGQADLAIENYLTGLKYYNCNQMDDIRWYQFLIGIVYCDQKNDFRKGLPYLQKGFDGTGEKAAQECRMLGGLFAYIGDFERSEKYFQMASNLEFNCMDFGFMAMNRLFQSKLDETLSLLDTLCRQDDCWWACNKVKFYTYLTLKDFDRARESLNNYIQQGAQLSLMDSAWLGYMYLATGSDQMASEILNRTRESLEKKVDQNWLDCLTLSAVYSNLGDKENTLKYLSESIDLGLRMGTHAFLPVNPSFESLWEDPEFKALVNQSWEKKAGIRKIIGEMEARGEFDL
jgi:TolB-like protein/Tfp pilus assembly protein PilF